MVLHRPPEMQPFSVLGFDTLVRGVLVICFYVLETLQLS
jgi:hypothetical protein